LAYLHVLYGNNRTTNEERFCPRVKTFMENISLFSPEDRQDNTNQKQLKGLPYFIVIQRTNKQIKIPCANETIAKKLLAAHSNNNSNSKVPLM